MLTLRDLYNSFRITPSLLKFLKSRVYDKFSHLIFILIEVFINEITCNRAIAN